MTDIEKFVSTYHLDIENIDSNGLEFRKNVILLNSDVIPGAPYFTFTWFLQKTGEMQTPHSHDFDEILGFVGSNPDDPDNLNGLIRFKFEDEWVTLDKSSILFIPAGMIHCPYVVERVDKPIIHFSGAGVGTYAQMH